MLFNWQHCIDTESGKYILRQYLGVYIHFLYAAKFMIAIVCMYLHKKYFMIQSIIRFSIKNKLVIGLFILALIIWGGYSVTRLPIDAVPDITDNQVQVITSSPALGAPDVERLILSL